MFRNSLKYVSTTVGKHLFLIYSQPRKRFVGDAEGEPNGCDVSKTGNFLVIEHIWRQILSVSTKEEVIRCKCFNVNDVITYWCSGTIV